MKPHRLLPFACVLLTASACGSGEPDMDPGPASCLYGTSVYEDSVEFESPDGCVSYRCVDGSLETLVDDRYTVEGDLELGTQAEVDAQVCLGVVEGALLISGEAADLTPLSSLNRVGRDLGITATAATSLTGLEAIGEIGGHLVIADNDGLSQLNFQTNMSVFGDLTIQNNDALTSLAGAEFISQCSTCTPPPSGSGAGLPEGGEVRIAGAPAGDGGLDEPYQGIFYGAILIADNDVLSDIWAMNNLFYAWSDVRFRNNAQLTSLSGLQLVEVQGDLEVTDHVAMDAAGVDAFAALVDVWGTTLVCGNLGGEACP